VLGVAAMLMLIFQPSVPAQNAAGSQRFDVARLLPKGKSQLGELAVNGPTIQFFKRDSHVQSEQSSGHTLDPKSLGWEIEGQDISEIKVGPTRTFDLGLRGGELYSFCATNEKLKCGAPVEKVIEALTGAVAAAPVAKESDAEPGDAQRLPVYEGYNAPQAHHFAPIPLPDGRSLSLEQTMTFIQQQLGALVPARYTLYLQHDTVGTATTTATKAGSVQLTEQMTNVRASAIGCHIDYHALFADDGGGGNQKLQDTDVSLSLNTVEEVVVMTAEQYWKVHLDPEVTNLTDPPLFEIVFRLGDGRNVRFPLYDEAMAHRIANSLVHAIEFCRNGPWPQSSTSVGFPASTSNDAPLGLGLSSHSQIGTPQDDKAFSEALSAVFSSASDRFANGRLRKRDFPQDRTITIWETSLRFPGTSGACQVWVKPTMTYMTCPISESFYAQSDSRPRFEEVLRALIRVLPDNWSVATNGLFGLDQLNRPPEPGATFITVLFAVPTHPEQAFRVTFTPSMGSIDLYMGDVSFCAGCSTMKGIAELRTSLGIDAPAWR
jgi:hypothetical protein